MILKIKYYSRNLGTWRRHVAHFPVAKEFFFLCSRAIPALVAAQTTDPPLEERPSTMWTAIPEPIVKWRKLLPVRRRNHFRQKIPDAGCSLQSRSGNAHLKRWLLRTRRNKRRLSLNNGDTISSSRPRRKKFQSSMCSPIP